MPAQPLTPEQLEDSARLKARFKAWQAERRAAGGDWQQDWASEQLGFGQSATSQYLNGKIPLNPDAASKFAALVGCQVSDFSESVAAEIMRISAGVPMQGSPMNARAGDAANDHPSAPQTSEEIKAAFIRLAKSSPEYRRSTGMAIQSFLDSPEANQDMLPLIVERLSGEFPPDQSSPKSNVA